MIVKRVSANEYSQLLGDCAPKYNNVKFVELNAAKCDEVHYLSICDTKPRLGIVLGVNHSEKNMCNPFSAPFGGFVYKVEPSIEVVEKALEALVDYVGQYTLRLTLPPDIYGYTSFNAKVVNSLMRMGHVPSWIDLNYHYDLSRVEHYESFLSRNARKNLNNSLKQDFVFEKLSAEDSAHIARAYAVIKANRESHNYALRMSLNDVVETAQILPADFFVLSLNGEDVAAAQVFHVSEGIAQVIYWGDCPGYSALRPMNFLAYKLCDHYHKNGVKTLDIGPSTQQGVPNYGLCEFKENLGCEVSLKYIFEIKA